MKTTTSTEPKMTLAEAKAEAKRRWAALGGWAEVDEGDYRVGIRRDDGQFNRKVQLGTSSKSFDAAFKSADKRLAQPPKPPKPRTPLPGELPNVELFSE